MVISLFITCYNDALFPQTGKAVVEVLERLGHTVEFRAAQTCCGQMHYNTGYRQDSYTLLRQFLQVFADAEVIVCPSSSCVAMMRDHYPKMAEQLNDPELKAQVDAILPRVFEFSELLIDKLGVKDVGAFYPHTVTLLSSCHALRSLHIGAKPAELLKQVKGLTLLELPDADQCCGFGGTFAVKYGEISDSIVTKKAENIEAAEPDMLLAGDLGCLMNMAGKLSRMGSTIEVRHVAEVLAGMTDLPPIGAPSGQEKAR